MDELSYDEKQAILKDVILREDPPHDETPAARAWRERCEADCEKIRKAGGMPELPQD